MRFVDRERRVELEEFLAAYVQTLANNDDAQEHDAAPHVASAVPEQMRHDYAPNANLAGPSNSGPEPQSFSGTGTGMRLPPSQPHVPTLHGQPTSALPITSPHEMAKAFEVVRALEELFEHSLERAGKAEGPKSNATDAASNEVYFANLLSSDFLSRGFVYLNLALTMAQIHRYNVTVNFVQRAVAQFSKRLELSPDGSRVRWKAATPLPTSPSRPALTEACVVANAAASAGQQSGNADEVLAAKGRVPSLSTETDSRSGSGSGTGSSSQQPSGLLAKSIAQSNSTAPTSVPSSGRASLQQQQKATSRPRRPTAAVLQPMHYFRTDSVPLGVAPKMPSAPAALTHTSPRLRQNVALPSPVQESGSSTGSAGQVLSATNLREHDRLQAGAARASSRSRRTDQQTSDVPMKSIGTGTLVFYKNGDFCTDLTTEAEPVSPPALPPYVPNSERHPSVILGLGAARNPTSDPESSGDSNDVEMSSSNNDDGLKVNIGQSLSAQSGSASHTSSLARLQASGMTDAIPSDFFTIVVNTKQVRHKRALTHEDSEAEASTTSPAANGFPFFPPPLKRPRLDRNVSSLEVISTEQIHHEAKSAQRAALELAGIVVDSSSDGAKSPEEWSYGQVVSLAAYFSSGHADGMLTRDPRSQLTRSSLSAHGRLHNSHAPRRMRPHHVPRDLSITPSPPHDDYLISLAAPSHAWAPVESGFHSSGRSLDPADPSTLLARRTPLAHVYGSTTNGSMSTGDERPISLDEMVDLPRA